MTLNGSVIPVRQAWGQPDLVVQSELRSSNYLRQSMNNSDVSSKTTSLAMANSWISLGVPLGIICGSQEILVRAVETDFRSVTNSIQVPSNQVTIFVTTNTQYPNQRSPRYRIIEYSTHSIREDPDGSSSPSIRERGLPEQRQGSMPESSERQLEEGGYVKTSIPLVGERKLLSREFRLERNNSELWISPRILTQFQLFKIHQSYRKDSSTADFYLPTHPAHLTSSVIFIHLEEPI